MYRFYTFVGVGSKAIHLPPLNFRFGSIVALDEVTAKQSQT